MNHLKNKTDAATSPVDRVSEKKKVNTRVNPVVNFQLGLIAVLAAAYFIIEFSTPVKNPVIQNTTVSIADKPDWDATVYKVIQDKPKIVQKKVAKPKPPVPSPVVKNTLPPVVKQNVPEPQPVEPTAPASQPTAVEPNAPASSNSTKETTPAALASSNVNIVMEVPLFPGCSPSLSRSERIDCLNKKMGKFVQRHFDTQLANSLDGRQKVKISVVFTIDIHGNPSDIQVSAPNDRLKREALRVIDRLPTMVPGKNNGAAVNVTYSLPITFAVHD